MSTLILVEHEDGEIRPATLNVVAAATQIGGDIHLLVAGSDIAGVADKASKIPGVAKVLVADDATYAHELAENLSALVIKHAEGYSHILFAATAAGKNVMPRVAALLDVSGISDIIEVKSDDTFVRPIYAGNALATVKSSDSVKVIGVRTTSFDGAATEGGSASVENVDATEASPLVAFYKDQSGPAAPRYHRVEGSGTVEDIRDSISQTLEGG